MYVVYFQSFKKNVAHQEYEELAKSVSSILESRCKGIEFVGKVQVDYSGKDSFDRSMRLNPEAVANDIKSNLVLKEIADSKGNLAGLILLFGSYCDKRFLLTGLPTLIVDVNPFPSLQIGFKWALGQAKINKTNFLIASYSNFDASISVKSERIQDLVEKVELFKVIDKIKNSKILDVQVRGFGTEPHEQWWRLNQE
ncbi:MAG: hypothetical protein ACTSR7_20620, partial [Promethearchaeota archaeon]